MAGSFGSGPNLLGGAAPGYVDPFSMGGLQQATGSAMEAMHNRYSQLGLGVPSGSPQSAAASGGNLSYAGAGTAEQMDLGQLPSLVGGIPAQAEATLGQMQNAALNQGSGGGSGGGKGGGLGGLTSLASIGMEFK